MYTIFISDLHIDITESERVNDFLLFLQYCQQCKADVYILGDLFNFWAGNAQYAIPTMKTMIYGMLQIGQSISIYFIPGNRDFLFTPFFQKLGGKIYQEGEIITLGTQKISLYHGDSFCTQDRQYQKIRNILRSKIIYKLSCLLPTWLCVRIGKKLRKISQSFVSKKTSFVLQFDIPLIQNLLQKGNATTMICGHVHREKKMDISTPITSQQLFILPESDGNTFRYLQWDEHDFQFREWKTCKNSACK